MDRDGNIQAIRKWAEIIVYLSQANRFPKELNNIKITSHLPKHLPPQYTAIIKWVKNSISFDDVNIEITSKYNSLFLIEEIMGTKNDRNRHLRIELLAKREDISMLNSGGRMSTDFKCPFVQEYRRRLIIELRKRPKLLPPEVQLFIPSEYRNPGDRIKIICNKSAQNNP
ncbi:unnamed protein product [Rotaria sp. Silwood2]|nr:unnamed protein product [Rotaria sp. Silwood2]CAF4383970.1 unnamed protein product [Rotaria sp. Silwood2]